MNNSEHQLTRLVILFMGRSGSTYLQESLNSHPNIFIQGELLVGKTRERQLQDLEIVFNRISGSNFRVIGIKTKFRDLDQPKKFAPFFQKMNTKVICLTRRNLVKRIISVMRAMELNQVTGDWNLYNKEERIGKITIDIECFKRWLNHSEVEKEKLLNYVNNLRLPTLYLEYEDLLLKPTRTFEQIFQFIGVESQTLQANCIKHTRDNLREEIENFDQLRSHYLNTPYEAMFDEVLLSIT